MKLTTVAKALAATAAAGLAYAHQETHWFEVKHVSVPLLARGQRDIRLLHLTDLHFLPSQVDKARWLASLVELAPDAIVDTGDNISSAASVPALLDVFRASGLLSIPGVFVGGSNDYYAPVLKNPANYLKRHRVIPEHLPPLPWQDLFAGFEAGGWISLNNARANLRLPDGRVIDFVGTDDAHHGRDVFPPRQASGQARPGSVKTRAKQAGAGARARASFNAQPPVVNIGVTHAPYQATLKRFRDDGVSLVMAGHTHGGQLRVPGFGALVTNCDLDRHRAEGLHGWPGARPNTPMGKGSIWLYVSAGVGTSPYAPFRFACRPSATLLTLTAA